MYNFNKHISKHLLNEYGGSEKKRTILLDDGNKYLLKFPDPAREMRSQLSYINNAISEYLGCKIAKSLDLPVQEVILGEYVDEKTGKTKLACACQDLRGPGEIMHEIDKLELEALETNKKTTFKEIEKIINSINGLDTEIAINFFYDMFILDALIGNTDRHNGNWAVLSNANGDVHICPIYDCGSSFSPLLHDNQFDKINIQNTALSIYSVIVDEKGNRLSYQDCLTGGNNAKINEALQRIFPKINLDTIRDIIDNTPGISDKRKFFYNQLINIRYEKQFIPALENITKIKISNIQCKEKDLYYFFKKNIKPLQDIPLFEKRTVLIENRYQDIMRISQRKAICFSDTGEIAIIAVRSNDKEIEDCIKTLTYLGLFNKEEIKTSVDQNPEISLLTEVEEIEERDN